MDFVTITFIVSLISLGYLLIKYFEGIEYENIPIYKHLLTISLYYISYFVPFLFYSQYINDYHKILKDGKMFDDIYMFSIPLIISILVWLVSIYIYKNYTKIDPSKYLRSYKDEKSQNYSATKEFVLTKKVGNQIISTYPRFTIYNHLDLQELFFDSSDFEIINKSFGTIKGMQQNIFEKNVISINGVMYGVEYVKISFMNLFDDYSLLGHTEIYEGIDTPYNIQIILHCIKIG